jgi:hypothetical protein
MDDLLAGNRDDRQQQHDHDRDRKGVDERSDPRAGQDKEDFLRRVGGGGKRVGGDDRQPDALADCVMRGVRSWERPADQT